MAESKARRTKRLLGGRYEVDAELGAGGMGRVFAGTDTTLGRTVAIKILAPRFAGDERSVERFRREAQAAARLSHPNIVAVFDTGADHGVHYIVMEHIEGRTLGEVLGEGPMSRERALEITMNVCDGLAAAHAAGVIHRDVKPGNIMLADDGGVRVMDFGIARAVEGDATLTQTGMVMGTASYLSPEQARGEHVGTYSDIYSLGCVLYHLLTGHPPFAGAPVAVAYQHVSATPTPPSTERPELPASVDRPVLKAMAKDPLDRYRSAEELRADLQEVLDGFPASLPPAVDAATQEVTERRTAVLPAADVPTAPVTAAAPSAPRSLPWTVPVAGLAALALLGLGLTLALTGGDTPLPPPDQPSPTTATPPPRPATIEEASQRVLFLVSQGLEAGELTEMAAGEIVKPLGEALQKHLEGDQEGALERVNEVREKVGEFASKQEITSDRAAALLIAIDELERAYLANPPTLVEESPPPEEDNGHPGRGKAKGHDNDKDED
ncbi:MAG: protein kinase domain-containing protein [Actinomycetota bacterium]